MTRKPWPDGDADYIRELLSLRQPVLTSNVVITTRSAEILTKISMLNNMSVYLDSEAIGDGSD